MCSTVTWSRRTITYIVKHNAHEDVEWNPEEVHYGAPCLLRNVLRPHLHDGWPEEATATLEGAEAKKLDTSRKGDASPFHI